MLEIKGILIPDEDHIDAESEAYLYGMAYAELDNTIDELLRAYYP